MIRQLDAKLQSERQRVSEATLEQGRATKEKLELQSNLERTNKVGSIKSGASRAVQPCSKGYRIGEGKPRRCKEPEHRVREGAARYVAYDVSEFFEQLKVQRMEANLTAEKKAHALESKLRENHANLSRLQHEREELAMKCANIQKQYASSCEVRSLVHSFQSDT